MTLAAAAPVLWPFAGSDPALDLATAAMVLGLLALLPLGWVFLRRRWGLSASGPLWPLLFFEVMAVMYAFLTPPWQMPDEPQHMLYVELLRESGDVDRLASGRVAAAGREELIVAEAQTRMLASLERSDVERWLPDAAQLVGQGNIPGPSEIGHPPLYYELAAGLTRPLGDANVLARLAVLRALGVAAMGWCVWATGAAARMIWPRRRRLAEAPLVLAAGIPTVAAFAGSANNDVLVNLVGAAYVLLLVAAATGWLRRHPLPWAALFVGTVMTGVLTKRTFVGLLLALPVALTAAVRWNVRRVLFAVVAVQLAVGLTLAALPRERLAYWAGPPVADGFDSRCAGGYLEPSSLCLERPQGDTISQVLPLADVRALAGGTVTFGLWSKGRWPSDYVIVDFGGDTGRTRLRLPAHQDWTFNAAQLHIPESQQTLTVTLSSLGGSGAVRLDGIALVTGARSGVPPLAEADGTVRWDGKVAENYIRDGSGPLAAFSAPGWLPDSVQKAGNELLAAAGDLLRGWGPTSRSLDILAERVGRTFSMFWATVGWLVPPVLLPLPLLLALALLTVAGWAGAVVAVRGRRRLSWSPGLTVIASVALTLTAAVVLRDLPPDSGLVVSGRYLFSGLAALTVLLVAGWRRLWPDNDQSFRNAVRWFAAGMHSVFLVTIFLPFLGR